MAKKSPTNQSEKLFEEKLVPAKTGSGELFEASYGDDDSPVECLDMTFENDSARREHFLNLLREKLNDPEFRKIEGFPTGEDEAILAMSDPPYYTSCPNPFLADFVAHYGTDFDPASDDYESEPFASDVSEGKNDPLYAAHSYHTKVPHRAIMHYILHYTKPGDVVFDGFCGTGMTGVAAQECGNMSPSDAASFPEVPVGQWGSRIPILSDLSVLPTSIAANVNGSIHADRTRKLFFDILAAAKERFGHLFEVRHENGKQGTLHYAVWSDVFICGTCSEEICFWKGAVDFENGKQSDPFPCPHCGASAKKRTLERSFEHRLDPLTGVVEKQPKREVVLVNYKSADGRYAREPSEQDKRLATQLTSVAPEDWVPVAKLPLEDRYFKDGLHLVGLSHYHRFYFPRTLHVLGFIWNEIQRRAHCYEETRTLRFVLTSMLDRNLTIRNRFVINKHNPNGRINGPLANTLYVPGLSVEQNPLEALAYKADDIFSALRTKNSPYLITTQSLTDIQLPNNCVDYIFIDPPFGHNIMYSELNGLTESWFGIRTNNTDEAVVSEKQEKDTFGYMELMKECLRRCHAALKPGRWMTVEFHNSRNTIWNAIQEAISSSGFVIADVRTLDKQKGTINQEYYTTGAVKQDLVISAYKPTRSQQEAFSLVAGTTEGVWAFVDAHLGQLPEFVSHKGRATVVAERQKHLLFDRMVAFHIQKGVTVPISAGEFYLGLNERYPQRDDMFFIPEQAARYDKRRVKVTEFVQPDLFVSDEVSAIQWLKRDLGKKPQTFAELQPRFMQEAGWEHNEKPLELSEILEQNFLCYDDENEEIPSQIHSYLSSNFKELRNLDKGEMRLRSKAKNRWYVPDPRKEADLERIRRKALLKEFAEYRTGGGKLTQVRTEALRQGFQECYKEKDFLTIIAVAKRVKEAIIQEDTALLMYYDNAVMLSGGE